MKLLRESAIFNSRSFKERVSVVGSFTPFAKDIFNEFILNPHQEMERCVEAYNNNPIFQSAVNTMKDFIKGGGIWAKSDDEDTEKKVQAYLDAINIDDWIDEVIENTIKTGNGFVEMDLHPESGMPARFYPLTDSSQIYINADMYGEPVKEQRPVNVNGELTMKEVPLVDEFYIQKVAASMKHPKAKWYQLSYVMGSRLHTFRVRGIPLPMQKIIHFKLNRGDCGLYGRSWLAASLNDNEMMKQIEQSIAVIAKHKSVPRKIITYGDKDLPADSDELNNFIGYMQTLAKEDDIIINKPVKLESFSYAGGEINLEYALTHIRKKIISGMVPDFMIGFGQETNKATAQVELLSYVLAIYTKRRVFLREIEKRIIEPWLAKKGIISKVWLEFGELELENKTEKSQRVLQLFGSNLITVEQALKMLNISFDGDEELKEKRAFELQQSPDMGGLFNPTEQPALGADMQSDEMNTDYTPDSSLPTDNISDNTIDATMQRLCYSAVHNCKEDITTDNAGALTNLTKPKKIKPAKEYPEGYDIDKDDVED